jgi:hypothetical protein
VTRAGESRHIRLFLHIINKMNYSNVEIGGLATFNMQHGFIEAIIRGFRSGFLEDSQYHHLTQSETLEV